MRTTRPGGVRAVSPAAAAGLFLLASATAADADGKDDAGGVTTEEELWSLSYRDAAQALQRHRAWLGQQLHYNGDNEQEPSPTTVLAYLSHSNNNACIADLFLSVLASTAVDHCIAALLNARWTVAEMVQALQVVPNQEDPTTVAATTLLLYGPGWEDTALRVARQLSSKQHRVQCRALPRMAQDYWRKMMPNNKPPPAAARIRKQSTKSKTALHYDYNSTFPPRSIISSTFPSKPQQLSADDFVLPPHYETVSTEDAVLVFTSGTTSGAKGVRLGHRALYVQCQAKCSSKVAVGYNKSTRLLATTVPFFHVGGLSSGLAVWLAGGTLVLPEAAVSSAAQSSSFDPATTWQALQPPLAANTLVVVPALLYALQQSQPSHYPSSNSGVRLVLVGGQSADAATRRFVRQAFPRARLVQTYACTEAASSLTFLDVTAGEEEDSFTSEQSPGSKSMAAVVPVGDCVGRPPPHVELRLFALDNSQDASDNKDNHHPHGSTPSNVVTQPFTPGIIATRGPHVMNGYWTRSGGGSNSSAKQKNTAASSCTGGAALPSLPQQQWLRTNDLGYWDRQGRLYFCGRASDSIRTGGETVLATDVERCLLRHDAIDECAVFGLPDRRWGETVACAVVVSGEKQDAAVVADPTTPAGVRAWCAQQGIAGYKRPRRVFVVRELPRNSSGKVLKFRLVERFAHDGQRQPSSRL